MSFMIEKEYKINKIVNTNKSKNISNWRSPKAVEKPRCSTKSSIIETNWRIPKSESNSNQNLNKKTRENKTLETLIGKQKNSKKQNQKTDAAKVVDKNVVLNPSCQSDSKLLIKSDKTSTSLTADELKILYEEPLNTTNSLKAIFGYVPKDEQKICKFSVNGECFKKSKCNLSHETKILEGWTKDKASVIISNCNEPIYPGVGTSFQVIPTFIKESGYEFYGQIISPDIKQFYELMNEINSHNKISEFQAYPGNLIPTLAELVLAKYSDNLFYRSQITDYDEFSNSVAVFFVDYGNTDIIPVEDIRKWKTELEIVPFQALHFTLDGIKSKRDKKIELKIHLEKVLLNKPFTAVAVDHFDSTYIKIFEDDGHNIINDLKLLGLCEKRIRSIQNIDTSSRIPG